MNVICSCEQDAAAYRTKLYPNHFSEAPAVDPVPVLSRATVGFLGNDRDVVVALEAAVEFGFAARPIPATALARVPLFAAADFFAAAEVMDAAAGMMSACKQAACTVSTVATGLATGTASASDTSLATENRCAVAVGRAVQAQDVPYTTLTEHIHSWRRA